MKDVIAAALSALCVVHCLALPILLAVGSSGLLLGLVSSEWFHYLMLLPISALLVSSLPGGWCIHRSKTPFILGFSGFLLLVISLFAGHDAELPLSVSGGLLLAAAHLRNRILLTRTQEIPHAAH
jgi:hypothetical protein